MKNLSVLFSNSTKHKIMKTLSTIICVALSIASFAQEPSENDTLKTKTQAELSMKNGRLNAGIHTVNPDSTVSDTTKIELKNAFITIVKKNTENNDGDDGTPSEDGKKYQLTWWNGIDIGLNGILSGNHDFNLTNEVGFLEPDYGKSRYIAFNAGQVKGRIVKDYVGFTMGLSVQFYNYKYNGDNDFVFAGDSLFSIPSGEKNVTKNKLRATYLAVPAMLEFNTSLDPDKAFHISAGVVGKILIGDMYKQKFSYMGNDNKTSIKGDLGFNRWAADAMVRVGYRRLTLFAQTGLLPLFDNGNTSDVYTFSAGLFIKV